MDKEVFEMIIGLAQENERLGRECYQARGVYVISEDERKLLLEAKEKFVKENTVSYNAYQDGDTFGVWLGRKIYTGTADVEKLLNVCSHELFDKYEQERSEYQKAKETAENGR